MRTLALFFSLIVGTGAFTFSNDAVADSTFGDGSFDKGSVVCAAVVPCDDRGRVREEYAHPITLEDKLCFLQYKQQCNSLRKAIREEKRKNRPGRKTTHRR